MLELQDIKNSLRIDHTMDDKMIEGLIMTAKEYVISAIDSSDKEGVIEGYEQFEWSVSLLVQHWYLNRQEASSERLPVTVQAMIQQMRGAYYGTH
ncbi:head-tail connector protein [Vagococcus salmoninarum]|uniref:DNA-packaging protein n=1 Tax=Vagococcus salmoninarum TaxID=2739 RepID=A0A429ZVK1_9ENTE|nr:head-tail connector protein [Vagococcus salmoninarum]RST97748.1 DNA-packaging protein [Vagococcus salmoninarum]RST98009.1 DNA-packaging protein [Vagococcus salmoninarum]